MLWSWDAFWTFFPCKLYKTFLGAFSRFLCPQMKLFAVKFRRILEVLRLQGLRKKFCIDFHDLCAPKQRCLLWSSYTFFLQSLTVRFTEKVMGTLSQFMRPKTKPFAAKFRRTLEVLHLQGLQKKILGSFSRFVCLTNKHSWLQHFVKNFGHILQFYATINLCCVVQTHCDVLDFHILWEHYFESEHICTMTVPTDCDMRVWPYAKQYQKSLGLAPQTCFAISELRKNEQILWNLT